MPDFSSMVTQKDWRATREEREEHFVSEALSRILRACADEPRAAAALLREASEGVTSIWFNDTFTDFPYRVAVHQVFSKDPHLSEIVFMRDHSPFFKLWLEDAKNWQEGTARLLVFKYGRQGEWVMCSEGLTCPEDSEGLCVWRTIIDREKRAHIVCIAPFDTFLEDIGRRWRLRR